MLYSSEKSFCQSLWVAFGLLIFYLMFSGGCYSDVWDDTETYICDSNISVPIEQIVEVEDNDAICKGIVSTVLLPDDPIINPSVVEVTDTEEQIEEEIKEGEMELLAQLIEAEAGNQDLIGKILVGDVVMNRCRKYGQSVEEVIFTDYAFSCIKDGGFEKAGWHISEESFEAARRAYTGDGLDDEILFFTAGYYNPYCVPAYQYGDHYFGY